MVVHVLHRLVWQVCHHNNFLWRLGHWGQYSCCRTVVSLCELWPVSWLDTAGVSCQIWCHWKQTYFSVQGPVWPTSVPATLPPNLKYLGMVRVGGLVSCWIAWWENVTLSKITRIWKVHAQCGPNGPSGPWYPYTLSGCFNHELLKIVRKSWWVFKMYLGFRTHDCAGYGPWQTIPSQWLDEHRRTKKTNLTCLFVWLCVYWFVLLVCLYIYRWYRYDWYDW